MSDIVLATLNSRYIHAAFGLRYLYANLGEDLKPRCEICEFTLENRPIDIAEQLLSRKPKIIGLSVYIWNIVETTAVVAMLKTIAPEVVIVLGGPEVTHESMQQEIVHLADYVVQGQGEISFRQLCQQLLNGMKPLEKLIEGVAAPLDQLSMPYNDYTDDDIAKRVVYVEASRGCPFKCEFCLSALDKTAKPFELGAFLDEMQTLYERGLRHFKFVDRTFNLKVKNTITILEFFLQKMDDSANELFLHFELIPDHLPDILKETIQRFPAGTLQFEIGIQTFNPEVQALISRRQDNAKSKENLLWLRNETTAYLHTDLIFGLPGEDLETFADSFNQLVALNPHEIQLGILKRLRGSPIIRHSEPFKLKFNPQPPYNILSTDRVDFATMQRINRFARYWDMVGNSGRFIQTLPLIVGVDPFYRFLAFSDAMFEKTGQTHKIALKRLFELSYQILDADRTVDSAQLREALLNDFGNTKIRGRLGFLDDEVSVKAEITSRRNQRQVRHR